MTNMPASYFVGTVMWLAMCALLLVEGWVSDPAVAAMLGMVAGLPITLAILPIMFRVYDGRWFWV